MSEDEYQANKGLSRHLTTIFDHPGPLLPLILQALGRANARPQNLETFLRRNAKLEPLSFDVFDRLMAPSITPLLAGIQRLMLSISELNLGSAGPGVDSHEAKTRSLPIQHFLEHTPNLQCLRLNFASDRSSADDILEWLGRRPHLSSLKHSPIVVHLPAVQFNNLVELDLGMVAIHKTPLVDIVTKFNLKSLNLWKVSIKEPSDLAGGEIQSLWPSFFTMLAEKLISNTLQSLMVGWPASLEYEEGTPHVSYTAMRFVIDGNHDNCKPENITPIVRYQAVFGSNIKDWLRETAAKFVTLDHIEEPPSSDSEDDELEDEFDESSEENDNGGEVGEMSDEEDD